MSGQVITRFAPSPTGFLHIGGARTALFNWLHARHCGGKFQLRIEDTDRARSTQEAIDAILEGMKWLQLDWDGEIVYQSTRAARHVAVANQMLAEGDAYHCYCSMEEVAEMRTRARAEGRPAIYDRRCRERHPQQVPAGIKPVIRFKAPLDGHSIVADLIQGEVRFPNAQMDDLILLRSDGSPTYMLSVVVDDHDMGITHVIRGDDHLTNAARQQLIYQTLKWQVPAFAHVPLIHGQDGNKLSKRHGALGIDAYREMGYLPDALCNYLVRLGWAHGDDEKFTRAQATEWFTLPAIGRSAARFDFAKLNHLNGQYLKERSNIELADEIHERLEAHVGRHLDEAELARLVKAIATFKQRANNLNDLADGCLFYFLPRPLALSEQAKKLIDPTTRKTLAALCQELGNLSEWTSSATEGCVRRFTEVHALKLGAVAQPLRAALTGSHKSPGIFEVLEVLGKKESLGRIKDQMQTQDTTG